MGCFSHWAVSLQGAIICLQFARAVPHAIVSVFQREPLSFCTSYRLPDSKRSFALSPAGQRNTHENYRSQDFHSIRPCRDRTAHSVTVRASQTVGAAPLIIRAECRTEEKIKHLERPLVR